MKFRNLTATVSAIALAIGMAGGAAASDNLTEIEQVGGDNEADVEQDGRLNETLIEQTNNDGAHDADVQMVGDENNTYIEQDGGNHQAIANTTGGGESNEIGIDQEGSGHEATVEIKGDGSSDSEVSVRQEGSDNVYSGLDSNPLGGPNADAPSGMSYANGIDGTQNFVNVFQEGGTNTISVSQLGNRNIINGEGGLDGGESEDGQRSEGVAQPNFNLGDETDGPIDSDTDLLDPSRTSADDVASQIGDGNDAELAQDGNRNLIAFDQVGNDHLVEVVQKGDGNQAFIDQNMNANETRVSQGGGGNTANVTQD